MALRMFERLPRVCSPLKYMIELRPCLESFTFAGKQSILVDMVSEVSDIIMNASKLNITAAKFNGEPVGITTNQESEKLTFHLNKPSTIGQGKLDIEFNGIINDKMQGLYRSLYTDDEDKKQVMIATHFEPVVSEIPVDNELKAYQFEDTPKMSTYLVAFAVGNFEYVETRDSNNVLIRVYSRKGYVSNRQGGLALKTVSLSLPFFGNYFNTQYPLPKVDLLAIPDFAGGAMENWGLITFRERCLLADELTASPSAKESVALVVSHELAHMWFGNLVTMVWWTDLWLKEGFATWIEYFCVNHCYPEIDVWMHFTHSELACALRLDALSTSHPIEVEVSSPSEIDEIFDTISYCKGASLINMLHSYLGDEAFRSGLSSYLSAHAYANATTEDLWAALSNASGLDVASLMRPWTQTAGFPVLGIKLINLDKTDLRIELSQHQYVLFKKANQGSETPRLWPIPVTLTIYAENGTQHFQFKHVLRTASEQVSISLPFVLSGLDRCVVRANEDATGFYHTLYEPDHLKRLVHHLKSHSSNPSSRFVFMNDGFSLAKAGFITIHDWLQLLPDLMANEDNYSVWQSVLTDGLSSYVRRLVHAKPDLCLDDYHKFLRNLCIPTLTKLGFLNPETSTQSLSHNASLLRSLLISTTGAEAGDTAVIREAQRLFDAHQSGQIQLPNDLRYSIYSTVVRHGTGNAVSYLMDAYKSTKSPEERGHILAALGAARDCPTQEIGDHRSASATIQDVLRFCLDANGPVRDQDRIHGLAACASWSVPVRLLTWDTVKAEWDRLNECYKGQFLLASLIKSVLSGFATEQHASEIKQFFDTHPVTCPRAVSQVLETLEANCLLLERDGIPISQALRNLACTQNNHH